MGNGEITVENVILVGDEIHSISDIVAYCFEINPKLAERIEIVGSATIDAPTQFTAKFFPDYTTNKTVAWSVSDTSIATISEDGVLTPVKNGTVTITATAKDGSGVSASKTISIVTSAKLSSLDFGAGVCFADFDENVREYTVYVKADMAAISLTPTYTGGVLRPNGSGIWVSGMTKEFALSDSEPTVITLHRQNVSNMSNSVYTITVVKLDSTIANVSEDGKNFDIISPSAEAGNVVVLALYNGERFVEAQSAVYDGDKVSFTTDKAYTYGKVMIFSSLSGLEPVCNSEVIGD